MDLIFDYKFLLIVLAIVIMLISYYPYIRDILQGKTKPHIYTWIIWAITQGTASLGILYGGSLYSGIGLLAGTFLVLVIILLSIKHGTKNITKSDTITLGFALLAVLVWWQMNNPFLAILMVSLIDGFGYIPSFRKTWQDPSSETPSFWFLIALSTILTLFANNEYNFLTTFYLLIMFTCNLIMFSISYFKKAKV